MNCVKEFLVCNLFFREKITKALFLERSCIQNLVASAGSCWQEGIRIFGLRSARISHMALAPARDIMRSQQQEDREVLL